MNRAATEEDLLVVLSKFKDRLPQSVYNELEQKLKKAVEKYKLTVDEIERIVDDVYKSYCSALIDPGEAVGTITAQSLGEPSTQMTLRVFHYAGVREYNVTLGLPRLIEIVDAKKRPETPIMEIYLVEEYRRNLEKVREIARAIEATYVENVASELSIDYAEGTATVMLDSSMLADKGLTTEQVAEALRGADVGEVLISPDNPLEIRIILSSDYLDPAKIEKLRAKILNTMIKGIKGIRKTIIQRRGDEYVIIAEGSNLEEVMRLPGVEWRRVYTNDIHEIEKVLGIEAARMAIIREIKNTLDDQGLDVDIRHIMLLADAMTWTGHIRQVGRMGIAGEKPSVFARATFETTVQKLVEGAASGEEDLLQGVTENVIIGQIVPVGTGIVQLFMASPAVKRKEHEGEGSE